MHNLTEKLFSANRNAPKIIKKIQGLTLRVFLGFRRVIKTSLKK